MEKCIRKKQIKTTFLKNDRNQTEDKLLENKN